MTIQRLTRSSRPRYVQVWLGEWPESQYEATSVLQQWHEVTGERPVAMRRLAVEWRTPSCGPSSYGLLGAEYVPDPAEKRLLIEVALSADEPYCWREPQGPTTRRGLTMEYSKGVLDGLTGDEGLLALGPGRVGISCGAYDVVGSSYMVFRWLTHAILRLLLLNRADVSEDELQRLLDFE